MLAPIRRTLGQALQGLSGQRLRSSAALFAVVFATALALAIPGLARTNEAEIAGTFSRSGGTHVIFRAPGQATASIGERALARLAALPGVRATTALCLPGLNATVHPGGEDGAEVAAVTGDPAAALQLHWVSGHGWTPEQAAAGLRVAVVGRAAAQTLNLGPVTGRSSVLIGGRPYRLLGVFDEKVPLGDTTRILVPIAAARADFPLLAQSYSVAVIQAAPENLEPLAATGVRALSPSDPAALQADYSAGAKELGALVARQLTSSTLALTTVGALLSAVLLVALMASIVGARRSEIGLRRSLGASRWQILAQFLVEGFLLALTGASIGVAVGVAGVWVIAVANRWQPVLPPGLVLLVWAQAFVATGIATLFPAWRAANIDPIDSLTSP